MFVTGESGLNTAMASYALPRFNEVLSMVNVSVPEILEFAEYQQNVLHSVLWNGQWIDRAWVPNNYSSDGEWLGSLQADNRMHLFPQIWTLLTNVLNTTETQTLITSINKHLRDYPNSIGAMNLDKAYPPGSSGSVLNGTHENGGIWPSQNNPLIIALSKYNASLAFDEWQKNSYSNRANKYPKFWPNIWTSSDVTSSILVEKTEAVGTSNWPNFPTLCTHAHSWPLYSLATGLVGVTFGAQSIIIQPGLPQSDDGDGFGEWEFVSKMIEVRRERNGDYYGVYRPVGYAGNIMEVVLDLRVERDIVFEEHGDEWVFKKMVELEIGMYIEWKFVMKDALLVVSSFSDK